MVYPAVNAFTASEPGILTKQLSEMNNFVSYDSDFNKQGSPDHQPPRIPHVTPEITKTRLLHSPESSSLSTHSADPSPQCGPRKRTHVQVSQDTSHNNSSKPFMASLALRPEHYRAVTHRSKNEEPSTEDFQYPHVPLTFKERKRLSDTLFFLSKEVPHMMADVSSLLRTARETNEWDLAVSEVLTQVVVALYCREGDYQLDGLRQYLLGIGISC
jgi:hypothetical protein